MVETARSCSTPEGAEHAGRQRERRDPCIAGPAHQPGGHRRGVGGGFSIPGHSSFARFAKLPPVEPKKVPEIVKFEAMQQIRCLWSRSVGLPDIRDARLP